VTPEEVTAQIVSAWDDIQEEDAQAVVDAPEPDSPEEEPEHEQEDEQEEEDEGGVPDSGDEEDEDEEESDDDEGEGEQPEESVTAAFDTDNPEIRAYLAKYGGDLGEALRGATELQRVIGRQGSEKAALAQRVAELEAFVEQQQAFAPTVGFLTAEQQQWVEEAVTSGNPGLYVQRAAQEGEFGLARAVANEWVREQPADGLRALQYLDGEERRAQTPEPQPVDTGVLLDVLAENIPDMRAYEAQMIGVLNQLGPGHPLVHDAKSGDVNVAARGIIGIYEIARASSASVRSAKNDLKRKHRQQAEDEREGAVVSSASSAPSASETPRRQQRLMPGLTLEQFDAEFAQ